MTSADLEYFSETRKISRHSAVFFAGTLFTLVAGYVFKIYVARTLGAALLGIYTLGQTVVDFCRVFASAGLPQAALRFVAAYHARKDVLRLKGLLTHGSVLILLVGLLMAGLVIGLRSVIALYIFDEPSLVRPLILFSLMIPIGALHFYFSQALWGFHQVGQAILVEKFIQFTLKAVLVVPLFIFGLKLYGLIGAQLLSLFAGLCLLIFLVWRQFPEWTNPSMPREPLSGNVMSFAAYALAMSLPVFIILSVDRVLLGTYWGSSEVGVYSIAFTTASFVPVILRSVNAIFGPVISNLYASGRLELLSRLFQNLTKWIIALTLPLYIVIAIFSREILSVFGLDFAVGAGALVVLATGNLVDCAVGSVGYMLLMSGEQRLELINVFIAASLSVILNLAFIPKFGVVGAAIASGAAISLVNLVRLLQVRFKLRMIPYNDSYAKLALPVVATLGLMLLLRTALPIDVAPLLVVSLALAVSYTVFLVLFLIAGLEEDDRLVISSVMPLRPRWARILNTEEIR